MNKKSSRQKPAFTKVRDYILSRIENCSSHGTTALPSTRRIAQECRVNRGTVLRAIHALSSEGLIKTVSKPSIMIAQESPTETLGVNTQQTLGPRSMEVCRSLLRDIIDCRLRPGSMLPSFKELRAFYGCSSVTIHAAINNLIVTGYLERFKHGYRIHQPRAISGKLSLMLIIPEQRPKTGRIPNRIAGFWIDIARECDRLNVNLETYGYYCADSASEQSEKLRMFTRKVNERALGYFIVLVDSEPSDILDVMSVLKGTEKPVAVWDVGRTSIMPLPHWFRNDPKILIIGRSVIESGGTLIGRRLIELGHRRVAVIMTKHWGNELIFQGLQKSFFEAGLDDGLIFLPVTEKAASFNWKTAKASKARNALHQGISKAARIVDERWEHFSHLEDQFRAGIWNHHYNIEIRRLFRKALNDHSVTCIVGIHWDTRLVSDICLENRITIPKHLSIVGVLNSAEHISAGITCCDWNFPAVVNAMVDHLLKPLPLHKNRHRLVEIQSILVERQSSGTVHIQ